MEPKIYLVLGADGFLKRRRIEEILNSFEDAEVEKIDGENLTVSTLLESATQMSFFEQTKVIVIKDFAVSKADKKSLDALTAMVLQQENQAVLVFWQDLVDAELKTVKMKSFAENVKKVGNVEICNKPSRGEIFKILTEQAQKSGKNISREAMDFLVEHSGEDLDVLANELAKLLALPDEISSTVVREVAIAQNLAKTYDVAKFVLRKEVDKALVEVNNLVSQKIDEIAILGALSSAFLDVYSVKIAKENGVSLERAAVELKLNAGAWRLKNSARDSAKMGREQAALCVELLAEADFKMKSSQISKKVLLEQLIVQLCGVAG